MKNFFSTKIFKKKHIYCSLFALILCMTSILNLQTVFADQNSSYNYTYTGTGESGLVVDDIPTTLFELKDESNTSHYAYCVDRETYIHNSSKYSRVNVGDADYYSKEQADHIRAIVQNAYPFISLKELQKRSDISSLTKEEAITGAQLAIWHYSNDATTSASENAKKLYDYYLNLPSQEKSNNPIGKIDLSVNTIKASDQSFTSVVKYKSDAKNVDGSAVDLKFSTSKKLSEVYPGTKTEDNGIIDGYQQFTITGIPQDAAFDFVVEATQTVDFDGYFYSPEGGRNVSQSLVGAYSGKTPISNKVSFTPNNPDNNTIKIEKVDSVTGAGLAGAVFKVGNTKNFDDVVYEITSNDKGIAMLSGLTAGRWYVKEIKAPAGYICYEDVFTVSVGTGVTIAQCKNTPYGAIEILKSDENNNPVKGATFDIYKGDNTDGNPLFSNLVSDDQGLILKEDIEPGTYTVIETKAPDGYHINKKPVTITVAPGDKSTISIVNETVKPGYINLYKKDAVSNEALAGSVIGVYSDPEYKNLIAKFTTLASKAVTTDALAPGTYYVKELSAPDGYLNDSEAKKVTVKENSYTDVTFYNHQVPKTAGNFGIILLIGLSMLGLTTATAVIFRKKLVRH